MPTDHVLSGKRVLVIEDEYFIASDLKRALTAADAIVVGPAGDLAKGVALAAEGALDAAVLDVNLAGDRSYPIADRLSEAGVPFLFLTGYDDWALPDAYRAVPRVTKPLPVQNVIAEIAKLIDGVAA
ncbi:response regulator [Sphingomonas sp.]|uniref:response regulator n=1 Tax=Sphingomonas sp. TaxID=28214 RepID=UPI002DD64EF9|nr:response regulator [Sphingomonas sp.]